MRSFAVVCLLLCGPAHPVVRSLRARGVVGRREKRFPSVGYALFFFAAGVLLALIL